MDLGALTPVLRVSGKPFATMESNSQSSPPPEPVSLAAVEQAWQILRPILWPTPLLRCPLLDESSGERTVIAAFRSLAT